MIRRIVLRRILNNILQSVLIVIAFTIIFSFLIYNFSRQDALQNSLSKYISESVVEAQIVDEKIPDNLIHQNIVYYLCDTDFSKYMDNLRLWSELQFDCSQVKIDGTILSFNQDVCSGSLHLINELNASEHFNTIKDVKINWLENYNEEIFRGNALVLVVPEGLIHEFPDDFDGFLTLDLKLSNFHNESRVYSLDFKVAGYYASTTGDLFCPLNAIADLVNQKQIPELFYKAVRFSVKDNNNINEMKLKFRKDINERNWPFAKGYENFSLLVKDNIFKEEVKRIERYIKHTKIIAPSLVFVCLAIAFLSSFLLQVLRSHETVLLRIMGIKRIELVIASLLEFILNLVMAFLISACIMLLIYEDVTLKAFIMTSLAIVLSAIANVLALIFLTKNKLILEVKREFND